MPRSLHTTKDHGKLYALMDPILDRFNNVKEMEQDTFKQKLIDYIEAYSFLTQIIPYDDTNLENLFVVAKFIANENLFRGMVSQIPELKGDVSLQWYKLKKSHEGDISSILKERPLVAKDDFGKPDAPEILTSLSQIIQKFNERFGVDVPISDADKIAIDQWLKNLENDLELRHIAQENEFEDFLRIYETRFEEQILDSLSDSQPLVSKIFSDVEFKRKIMVAAGSFYQKQAKSETFPPIVPGRAYENRLLFRQTIKSCRGFLFWIDLKSF
jgi:type I restriction enzyme R subunit